MEECIIEVKVQPKSSSNRIKLEPSGTLRAWVTAPPADGEANQAVIELIARQLGLPKSKLEIVSGLHSRQKKLRIPLALQDVLSKFPT